MSVKKMLAILLSAILGLVSTTAAAGTSEPAHRDTKHIRKANKQMLYPECRKYLERRAAWYRSQGNVQELRENKKARKAFHSLPYAEQKIQCRAAYEAFDDFDGGSFRR
ncbi:stress response protein [Neisseria meningitidis]|nr:stress response protein [Neisseria meningitidis]MBG8586352.1 stress response protein [Neisseria meningitidis]MBG8590782.1 stress response protein [Neisseria meningitidis]MBG8599741.1 stress response protein [Neisseria meningitidis]MBG8606367.1 stress response protein [Neisseria meningitidis]